jgi:repressor LexA
MLKLTARQEQILNLIKEAIDNTGFPPTRAEIAKELGFRSANAAEEHLQALARKGAIEISPGTSRGIRLVGAASADQAPLPAVPAALLMSLPLVGRVAAGSPILAQEHVEATYSVDPAMFSAKPDFLLKVKGWSMRDAGICDGDFLAVKKSRQRQERPDRRCPHRRGSHRQALPQDRRHHRTAAGKSGVFGDYGGSAER